MKRSTYFTSTDNIENVVDVDGLSIEECMKAQKALSRLALYENTGLDPEQIVEIDKMFSEQEKELAHYKKQEERLNEIFDGVLTFKEVIDELENVLSEPNKSHPTRCRVLTYEEAALWDKYKDKFAEIEESQRASDRKYKMSEQFRGSTKLVLKKCPFCGGKARIEQVPSATWDKFVVTCKNQKCCAYYIGYCDEGIYDSRQKAIEAWNIRKPIERIVEQLEEDKKNREEGWNIFGNEDDFGGMCAIDRAIEIVQKGGEKMQYE